MSWTAAIGREGGREEGREEGQNKTYLLRCSTMCASRHWTSRSEMSWTEGLGQALSLGIRRPWGRLLSASK